MGTMTDPAKEFVSVNIGTQVVLAVRSVSCST